jgi:thymidylate synthase ThyX
MIKARVIADSISAKGHRITTMVLEYPRFIHSEVMTHRVLSRNAASSRAIPVKKMIRQVLDNPAMPVYWGENQAGMQAKRQVSGFKRKLVIKTWLLARYPAVLFAWLMVKLGLHKQIANRILEPWMWMHTIVTATEWENFFNLRRHPDAQPEFKALADAIWWEQQRSQPELLALGEWHLPFIYSEDRNLSTIENLLKFCIARCARVSYLNHEGSLDYIKDMKLHDDLLVSGHMSPFEHAATPVAEGDTSDLGNFKGFKQYRKTIVGEAVFKGSTKV